MINLLFLIVFLLQGTPGFAASQSLSQSLPKQEKNFFIDTRAEVETKEQVELRELFHKEQVKTPDKHLTFLNFPYELEEIIKGYLYAPEMFRVGLGKTYPVFKRGAINAFVASSRTVSYAFLEMEDHSLEVYVLGVGKPILITKLVGQHNTPIIGVAVSPNNKYIYTNQLEKGNLWHLESGEFIRSISTTFYDSELVLTMKGDDVALLVGGGQSARGLGGVAMVRLFPFDEQVLFPNEGSTLARRTSPIAGNDGQLLTLQELDNAQVFVVGTQLCKIYDRNTDRCFDCLEITRPTFKKIRQVGRFGSTTGAPVNLLAGRISRTQKNRLFLLTQWGLLTYRFDYTKGQLAELLQVQKFTRTHFKKPATTILNDDGTLCATIDDSALEVWYLPTETRVFRIERSGKQAIPSCKLVASQDRIAVVDDQTKTVYCFVKEPDLEKHFETLPIEKLDFIQNMIQRYSETQMSIALEERERKIFTSLPQIIQTRLAASCKLKAPQHVSASQHPVFAAIERQNFRQLRPIKGRQQENHKTGLALKIGITMGLITAAVLTDVLTSYKSGKPLWLTGVAAAAFATLTSAAAQAKQFLWRSA